TLTSFPHDTGVAHSVWNAATRILTNYHDTGIDQDVARVAALVTEVDTGLRSAISGIQGGGSDTGAIADAVWGKDSRTLTTINDTGLNQRLDVIRSVTDTGLRDALADL